MEEVWRDVVGYEDLFKISNLGQVFSKRTNKTLKQFLHKNGYYLVATKIGGRQGINKTFKVHRLVADAFLPSPSKYLVDSAQKSYYGVVLVNHKDGNKTNNNALNLEWCNHKDNAQHALAMGLLDNSKNKGANNKLSFFKSESERELAYKSYLDSGLSMRKFAEQLGVTHTVISRLARDYAK